MEYVDFILEFVYTQQKTVFTEIDIGRIIIADLGNGTDFLSCEISPKRNDNDGVCANNVTIEGLLLDSVIDMLGRNTN